MSPPFVHLAAPLPLRGVGSPVFYRGPLVGHGQWKAEGAHPPPVHSTPRSHAHAVFHARFPPGANGAGRSRRNLRPRRSGDRPEVVVEDLVAPAAELPAVLRPDALAPVAEAARLG